MDIFIAQMQVREGHWDNVLHSDQREPVVEWCRQTAREFECGFRLLRLESHSCQFLLERYIGMRYLERTCKTCGTIKSFVDYFKALTAEGFSLRCKPCFEAARSKNELTSQEMGHKSKEIIMKIKMRQTIAINKNYPLQPTPKDGTKSEYQAQGNNFVAVKEPA